jgi:ApaG protein
MQYAETTHKILVEVRPQHIPEDSAPIQQRNVFAYFVKVTNLTHESIQLINRTWHIYDSIGESFTVQGEGVIGKQPVINPQESFEYNSFCVLKSMKGHMDGFYSMRCGSTLRQIKIPRFHLVAPQMN